MPSVKKKTPMKKKKPSTRGGKPPQNARPASKARWSLGKAMTGKPEGVPVAKLIRVAQRDWRGEFGGSVGSNRVRGALNFMRIKEQVEQVKSGYWRLTDLPEVSESSQDKDSPTRNEVADYPLVSDQLVVWEECTSAKGVGDKLKAGKWENPDVIGAIVPDDVAKAHGFNSKLVAVEVKDAIDSNSLFTGFGQACAYLDFAHAAYLVVPQCKGEKVDRVMRLCRKSGVGFGFIVKKDDEKRLEIKISPRFQEPDHNRFAEFLKKLRRAGFKWPFIG